MLLRRLWQDKTGCLSIQVLQEFYVTTTRKLAHPLTLVEASQIISDFGLWRIHQPQSRGYSERYSAPAALSALFLGQHDCSQRQPAWLHNDLDRRFK
jgi:hypothetical protein